MFKDVLSLSDLQVLRLSDSGSFPIMIGLLTSLESLWLDNTRVSGSLPSEVGLLTTALTDFKVSNHFLVGSIPSQVGHLSKMTGFEVGSNNFTSTLPPELYSLSHLQVLDVSHNLLEGVIPTKIGVLSHMTDVNLRQNGFSGIIPTEIGLMTALQHLMLPSNNFSGSIHRALSPMVDCHGDTCYYISGDVSQSNGSPSVDCDNVACECCNCPTTIASPSSPFLPTTPGSTSRAPTGSLEPNVAPSPTLAPSTSPLTSQAEGSCSPFSSIAFFGSRLDISGQDHGVEFVDLPFSFNWWGEVQYNTVTVASNGVIFPVINADDDGCCAAEPFTILWWLTRIAVAQADIAPSGNIFSAQVENAFVISWEGVFLQEDSSRNTVDFQALLFDDGTVELRWGEGNPSVGVVAAGIEDEAVCAIAPVTGAPFDDGALGAGVSRQWPSNQCRMFVVSNEGYNEVTS